MPASAERLSSDPLGAKLILSSKEATKKMGDPHDQKIASARQRQNAARSEAEDVVEAIASTTSSYLVNLAKYLMDRVLRDKPELIEALSPEELSSLKATFNQRLAELPEMARARIRELSWPHRTEVPEDLRTSQMAGFDLGSKTRETLDGAARELIGTIGKLLVEARLAETSSRSEWKSMGAGRYAYAYGLPDIGIAGGEEFKKAPELYQAKLNSFVAASAALYEAEKEKHQAAASTRWDEA